jgi:uncharacterized protein (TIGR03000 family)
VYYHYYYPRYWGYYPSFFNYGSYPYAEYGPGYNPYGSPPGGYQAFYPPTAQPELTAQVAVRVPANAEVWFNGAAAAQKGPLRELVSPPLTPGLEFNYEIRARWLENGREVTKVRQVTVRAGDRLTVDLTSATAKKG